MDLSFIYFWNKGVRPVYLCKVRTTPLMYTLFLYKVYIYVEITGEVVYNNFENDCKNEERGI